VLRPFEHLAAEHVVHLNSMLPETMRRVPQANSCGPIHRRCWKNSGHALYGIVRTRAPLKTGDGKSPLSAECLSEPDNAGDMPFS